METLGFWTSFLAGIFILLHLPACDRHWANRIKILSGLSKYHTQTLRLAVIFASVHIILSLIGIIFGIWI